MPGRVAQSHLLCTPCPLLHETIVSSRNKLQGEKALGPVTLDVSIGER